MSLISELGRGSAKEREGVSDVFCCLNGACSCFVRAEASLGLCSLKSHRAPRSSYTPGGILSLLLQGKESERKVLWGRHARKFAFFDSPPPLSQDAAVTGTGKQSLESLFFCGRA